MPFSGSAIPIRSNISLSRFSSPLPRCMRLNQNGARSLWVMVFSFHHLLLSFFFFGLLRSSVVMFVFFFFFPFSLIPLRSAIIAHAHCTHKLYLYVFFYVYIQRRDERTNERK